MKKRSHMISMSAYAKLGLFLAMAGVQPSSAASPPTAEEACIYFLSDVPIVSSAKDVTYKRAKLPAFQVQSDELDRYRVLTSKSILVEFGRIADGNFERLGAISASAECRVDFVDRRVIEIRITDGPEVDSSITNHNGDRRRIAAPKSVLIQIGSLAHYGQY